MLHLMMLLLSQLLAVPLLAASSEGSARPPPFLAPPAGAGVPSATEEAYAAAVGRPTGRAYAVTLSNTEPMRDWATGEQLGLGDGSLLNFGGRYYLYGVRYMCTPSPYVPRGPSCNQTDPRIWGNMTFGVASSTDLRNWTIESTDVLPEMHGPRTRFPASKFAWFMPTVVHREGRFALWYYVDQVARGVAVADNPLGPFKIVHDCVPNLPLGSDFYLWTAPDGEVYMKHNGGCGPGPFPGPPGPACPRKRKRRGICVAKLAHNLTDVVDMSPPIQAPGEGGGIFEREGKWYIVQGHGCCFCWVGDDAQTWESVSGPFGPYLPATEAIACTGGKPGSLTRTCGGEEDPSHGPGAQQFGVYPVPGPGGKVTYLYIGIRFGSAPDGLKCHERQYWHPLEFDGSGHVAPITFRKEVTLELAG